MDRLLWYRLFRAGRQDKDAGSVLVLALVAAIVLTVGLAALASRANLGLFGAVLQSKNREARDVAESAISAFIDTLNQPENRYLLIGGDGNTWSSSDSSLLNVCTMYNRTTLAPISGVNVPSNLTADAARFKPALNTSRSSSEWRDLSAGNSSSQFLVESVEYLDENRDPILSTDVAKRDLVKTGNSRGLIRVTIQGRVTRDGRTSYARVARELEVVPKCCWRSFGANQYYGAFWGRDNRACLATDLKGGGAGIIAFGGTGGSSNDLDIFGEDGKKISSAICRSGANGSASNVTIAPSPSCAANTLKLGKNISLSPKPIDFKVPDFIFPQQGSLTASGSLPSTPILASAGWSLASNSDNSILNGVYPSASPGNWILSGTTAVWVAGYPEKAVNPGTANDSLVWYSVGVTTFQDSGSSVSSAASPANLSSSPASLSLSSSKDYIYYDNSTQSVRLCDLKSGELDGCAPISTCYAVEGASGIGPSPYAEVFCNLSHISSGNHDVYVDTTNAKINLFFTGDGKPDNPSKGEYMGGGGNTQYRNVHCSSVTTTSSPCQTPISWDDFKRECISSGANADPRCDNANITNRPYDTGELFNIFTEGTGSFAFNGSASGAGFNLYAPNASVSLKGGGNSPANFMGRMWAGSITLTGRTQVYTLNSLPDFCRNTSCPTGDRLLFDMKIRSYTQASGF